MLKKVLVSISVFVLAFFGVFAGPVSAKIIAEENRPVMVAKTEVVDDDLFIGAQTVEMAGTVNGDLFIGAQSVTISGVVKGSVYVGAQNITVKSAIINGSLFVGAATVSLDSDSQINGSVYVGAGTLSVDSQIKRSLYAGTGNLMIGGNTLIGKDLYYAVGNEQGGASISPQAKISGNIYKSEVDTSTPQQTAKASYSGVKLMAGLLSLAGSLVVAFFYLKFFGDHFTQVSKLLTTSFWKSLGVGFLVTIAAVPGFILLLVTVVGIPLAGVSFLVFLLFAYLAKIVVSQPLGEWISKKLNWKISFYGASAFGLLTMYIIGVIPFFGPLVGLVIFWVGLGALTLQTLSKFK